MLQDGRLHLGLQSRGWCAHCRALSDGIELSQMVADGVSVSRGKPRCCVVQPLRKKVLSRG